MYSYSFNTTVKLFVSDTDTLSFLDYCNKLLIILYKTEALKDYEICSMPQNNLVTDLEFEAANLAPKCLL